MGAVTTVHGVVAHLFLPGAANEQVLLPSISEIMCMSTPVHVKHVFSISIIFHAFFWGGRGVADALQDISRAQLHGLVAFPFEGSISKGQAVHGFG